ncbi:MAG TPA: Gfo/Idh/MocA family oxidoreductase [Bacteroidales bacterium]|nr:Gfo/Idh/MocA family oxidoreductase [Bacteroidales bacterium]
MKRRNFIKTTAIGTAGIASSFYMPPEQDKRKLKIGLIGAGWYGMVITTAALKSGGVEVIGICDVDSEHLNTSADQIEKLQGTRPKTFKYYHDLLDLKGLEALFIGTIPHWHALQFIAGCEKGLDIYCEKPLSYDVMEGIAMVNAWEKAGNIVQIGFQRRQSQAFKKAKGLIETGRIGDIHQIVAQIHYNPVPQDTKIQPPPASLDWEEWCGPAPKLDYRPSIGHKSWRLEKEYGNGHLTDWGIHHIDIIRKIMSENMPVKFNTSGGLFMLKDQMTTPDTLTANMAFRKAPVLWQHRLWGNGDVTREFNNGIFFYGEKGTLFAEDSKVVIFPTGKDAKREDMSIPTPLMQENHVENFLNAVRKKDKSLISCNPEDAFRSTATVQLAMISYYTGSEVKWDEEKKEIIGNPEASKLLRREYRGRFVHP